MQLLIINPGSTSTKIAVYEDEREVFSENIPHTAPELAGFVRIVDQKIFRKNIILGLLHGRHIDMSAFAAVVGRGGLIKPIPSGIYKVGPEMIADLYRGVQGEHASNLGGLIAEEIARPLGIPAFIVNPVVVDELADWARLTGMPEIRRRSIFHALNHKYAAGLAARELGRRYEECNFIVCHLGGGITVGAHLKGCVVDVNNGLNGDGPITPERAGTIPAADLVDLCFSGIYTKDEIKKKLTGRGGMVAYMGTNDMRIVEARIRAGEAEAVLLFTAMAKTVAKQIGACAAVLGGRVDGIILTGGLAQSRDFIEQIAENVAFLGRIFLYPGENEMIALAAAALPVLRGEAEARIYT
jgi:butyrate kinase